MNVICGYNNGNSVSIKQTGQCYRLLLGNYEQYNAAMDFQMMLNYQGIRTDIVPAVKRYLVVSECFRDMEEAVFYEHFLRHLGFNTMLLS